MSQNLAPLIHPTAIIDEGCVLGENVKVWHFSHIMSRAIIGDDCNIGQNVFIAASVVLGNNVKVQNNVSIYDGVTCEDDVFIGPSVVFTNVINPRSAISRKDEYKKTTIEKGVSIGANATIVCGHIIGAYAMVGAGTVITKSVKPYALVYGNPGVQKGWISESGNKLEFDEAGTAICSLSNQIYKLKDNQVFRAE
jgi:UDP-2-acetamido-3-amino-2,3-dideoxy-glucuronate N-acetyltransferase